MDPSGKRRSFSQRLGTRGENEFRNFALRRGLTATKVEDDFGIDFFCQIDLDPNARASDVADTVVHAFVRATQSSPPRIKLTRADAENLLRARGCIFISMITFRQDGASVVYHRFVDVEMAERLALFLGDADVDSHSMVPADLFPEGQFREDLFKAASPGEQERIRIERAQRGLIRHVPSASIELRRSSGGHATVVTSFDFFDFFGHMTESEQDALYLATFGVPKLQQERLGKLALKEGVVHSLKALPEPYVLMGLTTMYDQALAVVNGKDRVECNFTRTGNRQHFGWIHPAGASLTVSSARKVDDVWVHEANLFLDDAVLASREDAGELISFIESVVDGSEIHDSNGRVLGAEYFRGLLETAAFVRWWRTAEAIEGWQTDAVYLCDAKEEFTYASLSVLQRLADGEVPPHFKFVLESGLSSEVIEGGESRPGKEAADTFRRRIAEFNVPIIMSTSRRTLIATVRCRGDIYEDGDGYFVGINANSVEGLSIECRPLINRSTSYPEVILGAGQPTLIMGPSGSVQGKLAPEIEDLEIGPVRD
ncbi:hypothetical protein ACQP2X_39865 [Actinoplanes sp. CA-131856]